MMTGRIGFDITSKANLGSSVHGDEIEMQDFLPTMYSQRVMKTNRQIKNKAIICRKGIKEQSESSTNCTLFNLTKKSPIRE